MVIKRDRYLNQLISRQGNGLIKIITGVRRCGKSFLLFRIFWFECPKSALKKQAEKSMAGFASHFEL